MVEISYKDWYKILSKLWFFHILCLMFRWCICQGSPEKQNQYNVCVCLKCVCVYVWVDRYQERKRKVEIEMFRIWLMWLWRLASPKSAEWASRLETLGKANVAVQVWRLSTTEFILSHGIRQLILWGPPTLGRVICFLNQFKCSFELVHSNAHPEPASQTHQNNVWPNIQALWPS